MCVCVCPYVCVCVWECVLRARVYDCVDLCVPVNVLACVCEREGEIVRACL